MATIYRSLLAVIAGATQKELARQIKYLKVENQILRSKLPQPIRVTPKERKRLLKFGAKLGPAIRQLISIVHPDTFRRWVREEQKGSKQPPANRGRRRTPLQMCRLILRIARETGWGYTRVMGELKKLGIAPPSRNTVKNILRQHGLEPGPKRGEGTWDAFIKRHAHSLWQCDFLSKRVLTLKGFRQIFVLVFLHVESRRVLVTPSTFYPNEQWVTEQARAFVKHTKQTGLACRLIYRDRDSKFVKAFNRILRAARMRPCLAPYRSPNTQAYVERFIQSLQVECLDHFLVFGEAHFDYLVKEYCEHYHQERPHQGLDNELLVKRRKPPPSGDLPSLREVRCRERLGGLLKHYYRRAA